MKRYLNNASPLYDLGVGLYQSQADALLASYSQRQRTSALHPRLLAKYKQDIHDLYNEQHNRYYKSTLKVYQDVLGALQGSMDQLEAGF
jgi:hypothetical protein